MSKSYLDSYSGKKVLITGGAGGVGSQLVRRLLQLDCFTIVIDNLSSGYLWNLPPSKNLLLIKGDITDDRSLKRCFFEQPDFIFHLAAFFANQNSIDYPEQDLHTNGLGTLKLLEYSQIYGNIQRFVYASSGCSIYPSDAPMPFVEELTTMYLSTPYQITKMLGELYCNYYWKIYGIPISKARFFNSFGPGEVPGQYRNVIPNFIYWGLNNQSLPITGTGEETRDFTYVEDIVEGLLRMGSFNEAIGEEINLAAGREIKIIDLANAINEKTGNESGIRFLKRRKWDTKPRLLASNEKARRLLQLTPSKEFDTKLDITIDWFKANWDKIIQSVDFGPGLSSAVRG